LNLRIELENSTHGIINAGLASKLCRVDVVFLGDLGETSASSAVSFCFFTAEPQRTTVKPAERPVTVHFDFLGLCLESLICFEIIKVVASAMMPLAGNSALQLY